MGQLANANLLDDSVANSSSLKNQRLNKTAQKAINPKPRVEYREEVATKEVEQEDRLRRKSDNRSHGYKHVQISIHICKLIVGPRVIPSWEASDTNVVHWEEDHVNSHKGEPEVDVSQLGIHHSSKHFREPMVHPCHQTEERGGTHYQVEVSNHKIGVV